ncbi:hypothetical protein GYMLUDRAFT_916258 [Collybiopsis luxurians FD-317 M1]|uniref:Uncharacterized protein n=1 Tax=Collybiopsis luxurians FD-317 M1 TaxID=944289 RepID=A0A0D0CGZ6_9AGAR|nr:hypothetical protein GYMLUDRAFT_916258 [Collybiopsis luxurians FD-317 M1]
MGQCANFQCPTPDDIAYTSLTLGSLGSTRLLGRVLTQKVRWIDLSGPPQRRAHFVSFSSLSPQSLIRQFPLPLFRKLSNFGGKTVFSLVGEGFVTRPSFSQPYPRLHL